MRIEQLKSKAFNAVEATPEAAIDNAVNQLKQFIKENTDAKLHGISATFSEDEDLVGVVIVLIYSALAVRGGISASKAKVSLFKATSETLESANQSVDRLIDSGLQSLLKKTYGGSAVAFAGYKGKFTVAQIFLTQ